jgi:hypothetical protein
MPLERFRVIRSGHHLEGAVVFTQNRRLWVRLHEKGGKRHEMPAHHKLEQFVDEYLDAAGIRSEKAAADAAAAATPIVAINRSLPKPNTLAFSTPKPSYWRSPAVVYQQLIRKAAASLIENK